MEGLDTVATVTVNGKRVHQTENMFIRHLVNVESVLKPGTNSISIDFQSKIKSANLTAGACDTSSSGTCPVQCWPEEYDGFCDVNFLRTEQCSFAWDWGPAFAPVGIWKPIYIIGSEAPVISDALVTTSMLSHPEEWKLQVEFLIDAGKNDNPELESSEHPRFTELELVVMIPDLKIHERIPIEIELEYGTEHSQTLTVEKVQAKAWWPNGYGD